MSLKTTFIFSILGIICSWTANAQIDEIPKYKPSDINLHDKIVKMDAKYFNAYNTCDMKTQAGLFDENIEFFHDKGGLATDKKGLLKSLKENICNKVTRTLIKGSIEVYPIKNYGAVQIGYHKFLNKEEPNAKSIPSKFVIIWKQYHKQWKIAKVISLH